jgi:hypothetical protein
VASTSDSSRRLVVDNIVKDLDEICKKRKLACQVRCWWWWLRERREKTEREAKKKNSLISHHHNHHHHHQN